MIILPQLMVTKMITFLLDSFRPQFTAYFPLDSPFPSGDGVLDEEEFVYVMAQHGAVEGVAKKSWFLMTQVRRDAIFLLGSDVFSFFHFFSFIYIFRVICVLNYV